MNTLLHRQHGQSLIEVLVSIVIFAFGILGIAKIQMQAVVFETEATQRAQAIALVQDMADRIAANRANAAAYVTTTTNEIAPTGDVEVCNTLTEQASRDVCEWTNLLRSASTTDGGSLVGFVIGARGCIRPQPLAGGGTVANSYVITVA